MDVIRHPRTAGADDPHPLPPQPACQAGWVPPRRGWVVLAVAAVLLVLSGCAGAQPGRSAAGAGLSIRWADEGRRLEIVGVEFRRQSTVQVQVGNGKPNQVPVDEAGVVSVSIPLDSVIEHQVGAAILVAGRAPSGASRTLVGAVPPRDAPRGPVDVVPWLVAALLVLVGVSLILQRRATRPAPAVLRQPPPYRDPDGRYPTSRS